MKNTVTRYAAIPAELKALSHWHCYCIRPVIDEKTGKPKVDEETGNPKLTKVPYQPNGRKASDANPETWFPYDQALAAADRFDGIGFEFGVSEASSGFAGVDLDHCVEDGVIADWAQVVIDSFASYSEFSVSGTGVHIIVRGKVQRGRKHKNIEAYSEKRYFCFSGKPVPGSVPSVEERQDELTAFVANYFPADKPAGEGPKRAASIPTNISDAELLDKALRNPKFAALWNGDTSGHQNDSSRADLALACHLAFWFGTDGGAVDRLFRQSALMRPKWDRDDYRERTISRALSCTSRTYEPRGAEYQKPRRKPQDGTQEAAGNAQEAETPCSELPCVASLIQQQLAHLPVHVHAMGLEVAEEATKADYSEILKELYAVKGQVDAPINFTLADTYNALPRKYGERKAWVQSTITGAAALGVYNHLRKLSSVGRAWPKELRRHGLPWSWYEAAAPLPEARKREMVEQVDQGQRRASIAAIRSEKSTGAGKTRISRDLRIALEALIEKKQDDQWVKNLLNMAAGGALDEMLGSTGRPATDTSAKADAPTDNVLTSEHFTDEEAPPDASCQDYKTEQPPRESPRVKPPRSASREDSHTAKGQPAAKCSAIKTVLIPAEHDAPASCSADQLPSPAGDLPPGDVSPPFLPFVRVIAVAWAGGLTSDNRLFVLGHIHDPAPSPRLLAQFQVLQAALPSIHRREAAHA